MFSGANSSVKVWHKGSKEVSLPQSVTNIPKQAQKLFHFPERPQHLLWGCSAVPAFVLTGFWFFVSCSTWKGLILDSSRPLQVPEKVKLSLRNWGPLLLHLAVACKKLVSITFGLGCHLSILGVHWFRIRHQSPNNNFQNYRSLKRK